MACFSFRLLKNYFLLSLRAFGDSVACLLFCSRKLVLMRGCSALDDACRCPIEFWSRSCWPSESMTEIYETTFALGYHDFWNVESTSSNVCFPSWSSGP